MAKFDKPANLNTIWASSALSQNSVYPSTSYAEEGWLQVKPPFEYENAINYKHDQMLAHINQLGVVEWDSTTEYQSGKSYVQGSNNLIYKCLQTHINRNPASAGNESFWEVFEGNRQATTASRGTSRIATSSQVMQGQSDNTVVTPATLISGFLGNGDFGNITFSGDIPFKNVSGNRQNLRVQIQRVTFSGLGNNIGDSLALDINYPNTISNVCYGVFPIGEDNGSVTEGSEVSVAVRYKNRTAAGLKVSRVSGSNLSGNEAGNIIILSVGY